MSVAVAPPASVTVSVTVAVPHCPAAGVTVTVRLAPDPPRAIPAVGSRVRFEETAVTVRSAARVSASPTVKLIGPDEPPVGTVTSATSEIVGGALTVTTNVSAAVPP